VFRFPPSSGCSRNPRPAPGTVSLSDARPRGCQVRELCLQDGEVSAVFDWELATVGDPLADVGWAELLC